MLELFAGLEYRRQILRSRLLGAAGIPDDPYQVVGVAILMIVVAALYPVWPAIPFVLGPIALIALLLIFTVILAPIGLLLLL